MIGMGGRCLGHPAMPVPDGLLPSHVAAQSVGMARLGGPGHIGAARCRVSSIAVSSIGVTTLGVRIMGMTLIGMSDIRIGMGDIRLCGVCDTGRRCP